MHLIVETCESVVEAVRIEHGIFGVSVEMQVLDELPPEIMNVGGRPIFGQATHDLCSLDKSVVRAPWH